MDLVDTVQENSIQNHKNGVTLATNPEPKGQYKSGRFWKAERKRFSSVVNVKPLKMSLSKKLKRRKEREEVMALSLALKEEKQRKKDELRARRKFNIERRIANEKKAEVVQVISNTRKLKKMSRKQMKYIETRDTSQLVKT